MSSTTNRSGAAERGKQIKKGKLTLRIINNPQPGIKSKKNKRFNILKLQPTQPPLGRWRRIEPGDNINIPPVIAETIKMIVPKLKLICGIILFQFFPSDQTP